MIYNPLFTEYKSITGAVPSNTSINFRVKGNFDSVIFQLKKDGNDFYDNYVMQKKGERFSLDISLEKGLFFYRFDIGNSNFIAKGEQLDGVISSQPTDYQLTVYENGFSTPDWFRGGLIYQIFPDRFCKSELDKLDIKDKVLRNDWGGTPTFLPNEDGEVLNNDFFCGNFKGIISKLGYLKSLGVTVIYLNPIFKAYSNHRYDTGDYMQIDPILGDINDFKQLIEQAGDLGIKIVLDGVFNHTGADSLYFNKYGNYSQLGAFQSKESPYYNWFNFIDYPNKYEAWWGIKTLPATNKNSGFVDFITKKGGVLDFYTKLGIGGWRLDVVDELPTHFVKKIRSAVKNVDEDAIVIGEVWEDASNKISYGVRREYFQGSELDSVMNYPLKDAIISFVKTLDAKSLRGVIEEQIDHYPSSVLHCLMNILSTHDTFRLISALSDVDVNGLSKQEQSLITLDGSQLEIAETRVKVASLLQYTLCGVPSLYYGEEAGMQGFTDPLNRKCYPWGKEDNELVAWYKQLGEIRATYSVFVDGDYQTIYSDKGVFVFKRFNAQSQVLIAVNLSSEEISIDFDGELTNLLNNEKFNKNILLSKNSFGIFANL